MYEVLLGVFLVVALLLIGVILIQQGKGADMGASFGAGASNTVFGSSGSGSFLTRATTILVILFFAVALAINYMVSHRDRSAEIKDDVFATQTEQAAPVVVAPIENTEIPATVAAPVSEIPAAEVPAVEEKKDAEVPTP